MILTIMEAILFISPFLFTPDDISGLNLTAAALFLFKFLLRCGKL